MCCCRVAVLLKNKNRHDVEELKCVLKISKSAKLVYCTAISGVYVFFSLHFSRSYRLHKNEFPRPCVLRVIRNNLLHPAHRKRRVRSYAQFRNNNNYIGFSFFFFICNIFLLKMFVVLLHCAACIIPRLVCLNNNRTQNIRLV